MLVMVGVKAVERDTQAGYVESVVDQDRVTIEGDDGSPSSKDGCIGLGTHTNPKVGDLMVGDKCHLVGEHVVCSSRVCYCSTI